jgi:hypothetical protein
MATSEPVVETRGSDAPIGRTMPRFDRSRRTTGLLLGLGLLVALPGSGAAQGGGPFGLTLGMPRAELVRLTGATPVDEKRPDLLQSGRVPIPHSAFESFVFLVDDSLGLCKLTAITGNIRTPPTGRGIISEFERLELTLVSRYGPPFRVDHLTAGSIWDAPGDWMMGLRLGDREKRSIWIAGQHGVDLPSWAAAIGLSAESTGPNTGYLQLSYEGKAHSSCVARLRDRESRALR